MERERWYFKLLRVGDDERIATMARGKVVPDGAGADSSALAAKEIGSPGMRDALLKYMKNAGASPDILEGWAMRYRWAMRSSRDPLPCPKCLMIHRFQRLILLPASAPIRMNY